MLLPKFPLLRFIVFWSALWPVCAKADDEVWINIQKEIIGDVKIEEGSNHISIDAPDKAEDAAVVPISISIPAVDNEAIDKLYLIIDKNPVPVVAILNYGPAAGHSGRHLFSTRVRMDTQSPVRAIMKTTDGRYFMASKVVNAAGGCSASSPKDSDTKSGEGETRIKIFAPAPGSTWLPEAQIMLRHPNNSGMQRNADTGDFIPARFIEKLKVTSAGRTVFEMTGGISISANPNLRFTFASAPTLNLQMEATDTMGNRYEGTYKN